jgi:hypothetical protein
MSTEKPTEVTQAAQDASKDILKTWPGVERDKEGNITAVMSLHNGLPFMATFKNGKPTGFGYV